MTNEEIIKFYEDQVEWCRSQVRYYQENISRYNADIKAERIRCRNAAKEYGCDWCSTDYLQTLLDHREWPRKQLRWSRRMLKNTEQQLETLRGLYGMK